MLVNKAGLIILDGWGIGKDYDGNAFLKANTPHLDYLLATYPVCRIKTSGLAVGLPAGQMGNSEVGHMNLGAGREIYQSLTRITKLIKENKLKENQTLYRMMTEAKKENRTLHLIGLASEGGVHSHLEHLYGLLRLAKEVGLKKVYVHGILDGRDVDPHDGLKDIGNLLMHMKEIGVGKLSTIVGRYYSMDRDKRWERIKVGYDAMFSGVGTLSSDPCATIKTFYEEGITDEFMKPIIIEGPNEAKIHEKDTIIFFNFRPDRARQMTEAITEPDFSEFPRIEKFSGQYGCFTEYDAKFKQVQVIFEKDTYVNTMGAYLSHLGLTQLRIAETEKYAHVTFFFNGGEEMPYEGEERILVHSPKVATYDLKPEMSAVEVKDKFLDYIQNKLPDFFVLNFANPDMVGHTGVFEAAVRAIETIDSCLGEMIPVLNQNNYQYIITADHGNLEEMFDEKTKRPITSHTTNPVYAVIKTKEGVESVTDGALKDISPTLLDMMNIQKPKEMTGISLIQWKEK